MESDQLHVPAVFRHFIPLRERLFLVSIEPTPFQQFLRTEFITTVSFFFCAEKGLQLESPDPLMGNKK